MSPLSLISNSFYVLLGVLGVLVELVVSDHFIPFAVLGANLPVGGWQAGDGGRTSLRALRVVMGLLLIAAPAGIYFHLTGNYTTEHDFDPSLLGFDLWLTVIRGEAPSLAPGTLAQFGLLGLLYSWRHPALGE